MKTMLAVMTMALAATAVAQQANTLEMYKQWYEKQEQAIPAPYGKALDTVMADLKPKMTRIPKDSIIIGPGTEVIGNHVGVMVSEP